MDPVFGPSIVWYLFLGGAGSGASMVAILVDLVLERQGLGGANSPGSMPIPAFYSAS
ncbi:MAG: hypothetical protein HGA39_06720 [Coriobacteriia bacterium]|nr:hypothetical protein [Coriobacteriia bacterium]